MATGLQIVSSKRPMRDIRCYIQFQLINGIYILIYLFIPHYDINTLPWCSTCIYLSSFYFCLIWVVKYRKQRCFLSWLLTDKKEDIKFWGWYLKIPAKTLFIFCSMPVKQANYSLCCMSNWTLAASFQPLEGKCSSDFLLNFFFILML